MQSQLRVLALTLAVLSLTVSPARGATPSKAPSPAAAPSADISPFSLSTTLGLSVIQYKEGTQISVNLSGLTAKLMARYRINTRWDVAASTYYTLAQLTSTNNTYVRFLGLNFRGGYRIELSPSVELSLLLGAYYTTMYVEQNRFGFSNMGGPQFFPSIRFQLNPKTSLTTYFKYSPIFDHSQLLPFSQREIAAGVSYNRKLDDTHFLVVGLDVADLSLIVSGLPISSQSISFGLGFGW